MATTKKITIRDLKELPKGVGGNENWEPTEKELYSIKLMAAIDFTEAAMAGVLRITSETFINAKNKYPIMAETLRTAKKTVEWGLYKQIADYVKDPEVPYERKRKDIQFLLARKHGWKEMAPDNMDKQGLPGAITFEQVDSIEKQILEQ